MPMLKIKTTISTITDVPISEDDVLEDVLEEYRETAMASIEAALDEDTAHITTEVVHA